MPTRMIHSILEACRVHAMLACEAQRAGRPIITGVTVPDKDFKLLKHVIAELCAASIAFLRRAC
jgi:hypothetical protein